MRFDVTDGPGIYSGLLEGSSDHLGLCNWIGDGVAIGLASMIDGCCLDHRVNLILIFHGLRQRFEEDSSHSLTGYIAIGSQSKAFTVAVTRDKLALRKHQIFVGVDREIDPASDGQFTVPILDTLTGQMDGGQRGGTGGIHRDAWPVKIEKVGDAIGN